jgi:hypothetical protein
LDEERRIAGGQISLTQFQQIEKQIPQRNLDTGYRSSFYWCLKSAN